MKIIKLFFLYLHLKVIPSQFWLGSAFSPLARDYQRLLETLIDLHFLAFAILMAKPVVEAMLIAHSS